MLGQKVRYGVCPLHNTRILVPTNQRKVWCSVGGHYLNINLLDKENPETEKVYTLMEGNKNLAYWDTERNEGKIVGTLKKYSKLDDWILDLESVFGVSIKER